MEKPQTVAEILASIEEAPKPLAKARKRLEAAEKKPKRRRQPKAVRVKRTEAARAAKAAKRAATPAKTHRTIELQMPHWINGIAYGPGRVTVPEDMVRGLLEDEQRVRENDAHMMGQGRAAYIGPGNRKMPVPYAAMDSPNLAMIEAFAL